MLIKSWSTRIQRQNIQSVRKEQMVQLEFKGTLDRRSDSVSRIRHRRRGGEPQNARNEQGPPCQTTPETLVPLRLPVLFIGNSPVQSHLRACLLASLRNSACPLRQRSQHMPAHVWSTRPTMLDLVICFWLQIFGHIVLQAEAWFFEHHGRMRFDASREPYTGANY